MNINFNNLFTFVKFLLVFMATQFLPKEANAQCAIGDSIGVYNSSSLGFDDRIEINDTISAGEYLKLTSLQAELTYVVDACGDAANTSITLYDSTKTDIYFSTGGCGDDGKITFVAPYSGDYYVQLNVGSCGTDAVSHSIYFEKKYSYCSLGTLHTGSFNVSTLTTNVRTLIDDDINAGRYVRLTNIVANVSYTIDNCLDPDNTSLTLFDPSNNPIAFSSYGCDDDGTISFIAPISGTYKVQLNLESCGVDTDDHEIYIIEESCVNPTNPNIILTQGVTCFNDTAILTFSGSLNDALYWVIYKDSVGEESIDTAWTNTYSFAPFRDKRTYFVRGEGGCVFNQFASWDSISLETDFNDPSFIYAENSFCINEVDPIPTISGIPGGSFSAIPSGMVINSATGEIDNSASSVNDYQVVYTTPGTCPNSGTVNIRITSLSDVTFSYPSTIVCKGSSNPIPTVSGVSGGDFSASPAGLVLGTNTGIIDLAASSAGTYNVKYRILGVCGDSTTRTIEIINSDNSAFSFASSSYCVSASDPTPTITGLSGGTFSSVAGLNLNSVTGEIDVSSSTPSYYNISYTTNGTCPTTSSTSVVINGLDNADYNYGKTTFCTMDSDVLPNKFSTGVFSSTPAGLTVNASSGLLDISASSAGTYSLTFTTNGTCPNTSSKAITISNMDNATINYSVNEYCQLGTDPTPTISGLTGGSFSSSPVGLNINASSGLIDLSASPASTYSVIYTTNGSCPNSSAFPLNVNIAENAGYNYSKNNFCTSSADPTPVITGVSGGSFSSSPGGLSVDPTTGLIDISLSSIGNYNVTYTTSGVCPNTAVRNIIISTLDDASFNYAQPSYCAFSTNAVPAITGLTSGAFTYSPVGLSILSNNGYINTGASDPGTYTITYTTAGDCQNSSTDVVTIVEAEDASFNYDAVEYCAGDIDPTPIIVGNTGGTYSSSPAGLSLVASSGEVDLSASTPDVYSVVYTTGGSCPNSSTQTVIVEESSDASFTYDQGGYCLSAADPTPLVSGLSGGGFSATPTGLVFNQYTGTIDVSASVIGSYAVKYSVQGDCPNAFVQNISIDNLDNAGFNYTKTNFCTASGDPVPTITGLTGGTFTAAPAGLVLNTATGEVDVSASTIGNYTITYTTSGACVNTSSKPFNLGNFDDATFNYNASSYCVTALDPMPIITGLAGGNFSSSPVGLIVNLLSGKIDVSASTPNTYTVSYTTAGDCPFTFDQSITINAIDDPSFSFSSTDYCASDIDPTATVTGLSGGVFSSLPSGLNIGANSGLITLASSLVKTYTIKYTTAGSCPSSSTQTVTVNGLDDAGFNYGQPSFCTSSANPFPNVTGDFGGVFTSSPTGLILNASSGEIDIATSALNNYTITYTTQGTCPSSSNQSVVLNSADDASFHYDAGIYCVSNPNPTPIITGISGGAFSFSPSGLSFNSVDGTINLSNSLFGTYTVTYTTGGICGNSTSQVIMVTDTDDAGFTYGASHFCTNDADAIANITGLPGGVFSTSSTDLIVNATTGLVDVDASVPGDYIVTYTTSSSCPTPNAKLFKLANVPVVNQVVNGCDSVTLNGNKYFTSQIVKDTLSGVYCDSVVNTDLVMNFANTGVDVLSAWCSQTWIDGNEYFSSDNNATFMLANQFGCDSLVVLDLTITSVDTSVTLEHSTFISGATNATYQWVNCTQGYSEIPNANGKKFTPIQNGNYAVIVTENACTDTSACIFLTNVGVDVETVNMGVSISPNPFNELLTFQLKASLGVNIVITNIEGNIVYKGGFNNQRIIQLSLDELANGLYFVAITVEDKQEVYKVIKS